MKPTRLKQLTTLLLVAGVMHLSACGYFLYPERRGQDEGQIDTAVALLDAAGLLIGIIPGVIAFAVDIATGTIYLPQQDKTLIEKHLDVLRGTSKSSLYLPSSPPDRNIIAQQLEAALDQPIAPESIQFYPLDSGNDELLAAFEIERPD